MTKDNTKVTVAQKEAALKYSLAGMVVYVQATGGRVLSATIEGGSHTLIEIEDCAPHIGINCWGDSRQIDAQGLAEWLSRANGIITALTAVANIGAQASGWWASTLVPGIRFADSLPDEGVGERWDEQMLLIFAESLGIDPDGFFWGEMVNEIYEDSRKVLVTNWFAVEFYRQQLDEHGKLIEFLKTSDEYERFLIPFPLTDEKVREMWEEVEFCVKLCARKHLKETGEEIEY